MSYKKSNSLWGFYLSLFVIVLVFSSITSKTSFKGVKKYKNSIAYINKDEVKLNVKSDDDILSFFALGDWGGIPNYPFRTIIEDAVSNEMTILANKYNTAFQLAIGDNFYFNGVANVTDKRFKQTYEDVFNKDPLNNTAWFMALGNHDHYGNAEAQIEYTQKSHKWVLPNYNYTLDAFLDNDPLIHFVIIDTIQMCGNSPHDFSPQKDKQPKLKGVRENLVAKEYMKSLEERLNKIGDSDYPYVIVAGHFPVWSIAEHGSTKCLIDQLRPLLHKNKVSVYFSGHDHNLQHISDNFLDQTVDYVVTGASNFNDNSTANINTIPPNSLKFHYGDGSTLNGGFCLIRANLEKMTITFHETTGKELYQTVVYPRQQAINK